LKTFVLNLVMVAKKHNNQIFALVSIFFYFFIIQLWNFFNFCHTPTVANHLSLETNIHLETTTRWW